MKSRREARETALQALYQCDALDDWSDEAIELFYQSFGSIDGEHEQAEIERREFSRTLIKGVASRLEIIDSRITAASHHWSLSRMSRVDRNLLRLAVYEMEFIEEIPFRVSINEAIEIAKRYSADDAPMFINGVLDNIASNFLGLVKEPVAAERRRKAVND